MAAKMQATSLIPYHISSGIANIGLLLSIVLGSLNGNFEVAFKKLAALHVKQDFGFAIITGNLFGLEQDDDALTRLLQGQVALPLTTYFTVGTSPLPQRVLDRLQTGEDVSAMHILALEPY